MSALRLFLPIGKVDAVKRIVYGTLTAEVPDKADEIFDYESESLPWKPGLMRFMRPQMVSRTGTCTRLHSRIAAVPRYAL
jgi:hypothetical protein